MSADERRGVILRAAAARFATTGYEGTSTESIARDSGISQPYLFRLFPTKKALFIASCDRVHDRVEQTFRDAAGDLTGAEAMQAMGRAYAAVLGDRVLLMHMMQGFTTCDDPEIREAVQRGFRRLWDVTRTLTGMPTEDLRVFFAFGMLHNVVAAMRLAELDEPWAAEITSSLSG